jgi:hypothetical protein
MGAERRRKTMNHAVKHPSPPLLPVSLIHLALFAASLVLNAVLSGGAFFPSPFAPDVAQAHFSAHPAAALVAGFFVFCSAIPLGLFAATVTSRLQFFGVRVAGVNIASFGGTGAALALGFSGLCMWALGQPGVALQAGATRALHLLAFAAGGPGFAVMFGLLALGVSLAGGLSRLLPRWVMGLGVVLGILGELASLSVLWSPAAILLPLVRFPGLVWLVSVGACLPSTRQPAREPEAEQKAVTAAH